MQKHQSILRFLAPMLLAAALILIWILTVQTPSETMSLSGWWADLMVRLGIVNPAQASFFVRKAAHTIEFFPVGVLAADTSALWFGKRLPLGRIVLVSMVFCAACSLSDQIHKLFVVGREFDGRDLLCDALGYLSGLALVLLLYALKKKRAWR